MKFFISRKELFIILCALFIITIVVLLAIIFHTPDYFNADDEVDVYLISNDKVEVIYDDDYILFNPTNNSEIGIILYPGAKVDYKAYAPLAFNLAQDGVACFLASVPLNISLFDVDACEDIIDDFDNIKAWYLAGHSMGGEMITLWASAHSDEVEGVILLASFAPSDISDLRVLSILASQDNVISMSKYNRHLHNLPDDYTEVVIEGGLHSYFGFYGEESDSYLTNLSKNEQLEIVENEIIKFIK